MPKHKQSRSATNSGKRVLGEFDSKRVARGEDMYGYGEQKKPLNLSLTPTAIELLNFAADKQSLSKSEFVEQLIRGEIPMATKDRQKIYEALLKAIATPSNRGGEMKKAIALIGGLIGFDIKRTARGWGVIDRAKS